MPVENLGKGGNDGLNIGKDATHKVGFYGTTPVAQQTDASQVAFTDSTTGTVADTLAAGVGVTTVAIPITLANVADGDILTAYTPGYKFKVLSVDFAVGVPVTTADKLSTLNVEIGTTNLTGGAVALTSANCTPLGAVVAGSAVTGANTGGASDTISVEASSTTAFAEGDGYLLLSIQNMDTADAFASIADKWNEVRSVMVTLGLMSGAA